MATKTVSIHRIDNDDDQIEKILNIFELVKNIFDSLN